MTALRRCLAAVAVVALAVGLVAADEREEPRRKITIPPETLNQPPAPAPPRDNPAARSPGMRFATGPYVSVQVNVDSVGHNIVGDAANEPSLAVNPQNRANMVVGWRQFDSVESDFREAGWAYTFNKGASWTFPGVLENGTFRSDPVVDVDASGVFFYQSLATGPPYRVDVFMSPNGGVNWAGGTYEFGGDKNWFVIDRTGGPGHGYHYGMWQRYVACCGDGVLTRSVNGGQSYSGPTPVAMWPIFGTIALGPDGALFAAGIDGSEPGCPGCGSQADPYTFVVAHTTNAPNPAFPPTTAGTVVDMDGYLGFAKGPNPAGLLGQVNVITDQSTAATRGNVYVLTSVIPDGYEPSRVTFARSVDGGLTFSPPSRVNDDAVDMRHWHWLAAGAVAPNGRIDVIWFDTRESATLTLCRLYYAFSWDGGVTWSPNVPVSPTFNSSIGWPQQHKMGDYSGIVADATGADVAYAATFNGEQDVYYARLFPDCNGNGVSDVTDVAEHTSQDCNLSHVPDECEAAPMCVGAGSVPDSLRVAKSVGEDIALSWDASCVSGDSDYAVYEGSLGDFASHAPRACGTGGARSWTLTPAAQDAYYLIVPVHADREGSYGTDGSGAERPPGAGACAPQTLHACGGA